MSSVNKAIIIGNLGKDPELRQTSNGNPVCEFTVATSERWNSREGEAKERTEWHRIIVWGKQGEIAAKYLAKGRKVYVEGRIQTRDWQDKDGNKRYTTEIVANNVVFLSSRGESQGNYNSPPPPSDEYAPKSAPQSNTEFSDDEIPF